MSLSQWWLVAGGSIFLILGLHAVTRCRMRSARGIVPTSRVIEAMGPRSCASLAAPPWRRAWIGST